VTPQDFVTTRPEPGPDMNEGKMMRKIVSSTAVLLATATALAGAAPVWADDTNGYGVSTATNLGDPFLGGGSSAYRTGRDSSGNFTRPGDTPPVQNFDCATAVAAGRTCFISLGGNQNPGYNSTESTSSAALTTSLTPDNLTLLTSSAASRASLESGQLGVEVTSSYRHSDAAFAALNDTLTFSFPGANGSTITNIGVSFTLDGALSAPGGIAEIAENLNFGGANAYVVHTLYGPEHGGALATRLRQSGWVSYEWGSTTTGLTTFSGVYALTGAAPVLGISNNLLAGAGNGARSLYNHTSQLGLTLPSGASYTSASGTFLSALGGGVGGVPEPATWAMMIFGFGFVGSAMRRRRNSALPTALPA